MSYKVTHRETGDTVQVDENQLAMYASQGWETSPNAPKVSEDELNQLHQ